MNKILITNILLKRYCAYIPQCKYLLNIKYFTVPMQYKTEPYPICYLFLYFHTILLKNVQCSQKLYSEAHDSCPTLKSLSLFL